MKIPLTSFILLVLLLIGCRKQPIPDVLIFQYSDFGPQVIAHELVGIDWRPRVTHGYEDDPKQYTFQIVVYDGPLDIVKAKYPAGKDQADYRYVSRTDALAFLKKKIAECESASAEDPSSGAVAIATTLKLTLHKIENPKGN